MSRLEMKVDRIGLCLTRAHGTPGLFHRGKVHLARKFRVWFVPGNDAYCEYDPVEFVRKFKVDTQFTPEDSTG